jgi:hypothetical protein
MRYRRSDLHVAPNSRGIFRQHLQHRDPCIFDGGGNGDTDSVAVLDAFDWTTNPPPPLTAVIYRAEEIGWASQTNLNYQVGWASILNSNQWFNLGSPVAGNGSTNYIFDSTRGNPTKFYRVRQVP